jgi:hypothetical protein
MSKRQQPTWRALIYKSRDGALVGLTLDRYLGEDIRAYGTAAEVVGEFKTQEKAFKAMEAELLARQGWRRARACRPSEGQAAAR